ncbi:MAG: tripartite tricarboxylate transporter substrate binding protein [Betaproteobacteria bacterium]|nr:tripartite tricarboxylate transporter substrate binding protein [Betaproteobacteria bacterium]
MKMFCKLIGLFAVLVLACAEVAAQTYPTKPIKWIVGFAPGGGNDVLARVIAPKISELLGQQVIVENKTGAEGRIAAEFVAKSAPDGYTIMSGASGQMVYNVGLFLNVPYDPIKSFAPITVLGYTQLVFASNPSVQATTLKEFIALAKSKPGAMFYASPSSPHYVAFELFKKQAGVDLRNVPYKGDSQATMAAISGEVSVASTGLGNALPQLKAGKIRALAVTGSTRSPFAPDIPTVKESGIDFEGVSWTGLFAPAATPQPILDRLYAAFSAAVKDPATKERILGAGYETTWNGMPSAEFAAFHKADLAKWTKVIKDIGIKPQ